MENIYKRRMQEVKGELLYRDNGNLSKHMEHVREAFFGYS